MNPNRELRAAVLINASPEIVWAALTDFRNLAHASPELVTMIPMTPGDVRPGKTYIGLNRRGWVVWPTRNVIVTANRGQTLAWDTTTSGARWIFELTGGSDGTRLIQRRSVPRRLTLSGRLFAAALLGGGESHADELEAAMACTLSVIKETAESESADGTST